jgi:hypothetical protein
MAVINPAFKSLVNDSLKYCDTLFCIFIYKPADPCQKLFWWVSITMLRYIKQFDNGKKL